MAATEDTKRLGPYHPYTHARGVQYDILQNE